MVVVGYTPDEFSIGGKRLAQNEFEIAGSRGGSREDLVAIADLVAGRHLKSIVTNMRPLREVNEALADLREGRVLGRLVLNIPE
jgi:D-arabinose 1-dehydrogenase-like Zn-dependent alcohol dehydrogenase